MANPYRKVKKIITTVERTVDELETAADDLNEDVAEAQARIEYLRVAQAEAVDTRNKAVNLARNLKALVS